MSIPGNCVLFPNTQILNLLGCGEVIHLLKPWSYALLLLKKPEKELLFIQGEDIYFWAVVKGSRDKRAQTLSPFVELWALSGRKEHTAGSRLIKIHSSNSCCTATMSLPLPCKKLKQYLGTLLLFFHPWCYLRKTEVSSHTELFLQLLLLENSPSCSSLLSHVLNPQYFTNMVRTSVLVVWQFCWWIWAWSFSGFQPVVSAGKGKLPCP